MPPKIRSQAGYELDKVQRGDNPSDWKAIPNLGVGVREIRIRTSGGAWRVVYIANRPEAIYVLHGFHKKSPKISTREIAAIKSAYKELE